ncbi:hypothetical protein GCM10009863_12850 [Streptomyces axinellae]|uniref:Uncharacterized protein n=1 Tax=Streptomyces axinellae TaxID=552788 RepID=A0ABN3PSV9_9ACTN
MGVAEAVFLEPGEVQRPFAGALRVPEPGREHPAVHNGGAIGREDHVGQPADRLDQLDTVAEVPVKVVQALPLGEGEAAVGRLPGLHPRVDGVRDVEVAGPARQQAPRAGGLGHAASFFARVRHGAAGCPAPLADQGL